MAKKKSNYKSNCCNEKIIVRGIGDFDDKDRICTMHFECTKCHMDCNVHIGIRKTWEINPSTRIVPNKKKKSSIKLTAKELKEIHRSEDL